MAAGFQSPRPLSHFPKGTMRAYFELNDKGTCRRFTLVQGVREKHTFIQEGTGGSKLRFEGTPEQFDLLMRDIYGVISPVFRNKAIFVHVEVPDVAALEARIAELEADKAKLSEQLQAALKPRKHEPITHPFPLSTPPRAKVQKHPAEDIGLPVGPGALPTDEKLTPVQKRKATLAEKKAGIAKPKAPKKTTRKHALA